MRTNIRKVAAISGLILGIYVVIQYLFPFILPFLLGAALALAADPMVRFFSKKLHFPLGLASILGVFMTFAILSMVLLVLCALLLRQLQALSGILPNMEQTIRTGMNALSGWLLGLTSHAPEVLQAPLTRNVESIFSNGSALLEQVTGYLLRLASGVLSQIPNGAFSFGT